MDHSEIGNHTQWIILLSSLVTLLFVLSKSTMQIFLQACKMNEEKKLLAVLKTTVTFKCTLNPNIYFGLKEHEPIRPEFYKKSDIMYL